MLVSCEASLSEFEPLYDTSNNNSGVLPCFCRTGHRRCRQTSSPFAPPSIHATHLHSMRKTPTLTLSEVRSSETLVFGDCSLSQWHRAVTRHTQAADTTANIDILWHEPRHQDSLLSNPSVSTYNKGNLHSSTDGLKVGEVGQVHVSASAYFDHFTTGRWKLYQRKQSSQ